MLPVARSLRRRAGPSGRRCAADVQRGGCAPRGGRPRRAPARSPDGDGRRRGASRRRPGGALPTAGARLRGPHHHPLHRQHRDRRAGGPRRPALARRRGVARPAAQQSAGGRGPSVAARGHPAVPGPVLVGGVPGGGRSARPGRAAGRRRGHGGLAAAASTPCSPGTRTRISSASPQRRPSCADVSVIAGGPGTGKTTTVARVLVLLDEQASAAGRRPPLVALAAPTGKAAARLEEAVKEEAGAPPDLSGSAGAALRTPGPDAAPIAGLEPESHPVPPPPAQSARPRRGHRRRDLHGVAVAHGQPRRGRAPGRPTDPRR